jgi:hypothetical protein
MVDLHKNFAYSTVLTAPSPATSGTTLTVQSGDGTKFPTPPFNAVIWPSQAAPTTTNAEIVRVTGIAGDVLTFTRAQESTSARAVVAGDQIAATVTAKTLTDAEGPPTCRCYNSTNFSVPNNSQTAVTFDTNRYDPYGMHSTSSNTSRITIPTGWAGTYVISGTAAYAAVNTTGERDLNIGLNGGNSIASVTTFPSATIATGITITTIYRLAVGDYVELRAYQNSGGALNLTASPNYSPEFSIGFLAA